VERDLGQAVDHLRRADAVMAGVIERIGPCGLKVYGESTPFAALAQSIVYQQISGRAAASIFSRLSVIGGRGPFRPAHVLRASDADLRGCGLSRQKVAAIRDLAQKGARWRMARLRTLDEEAVIETLTSVHGVGRWTAEMFLMFRLGMPDVLPVDDYGIRKAMQRAYRMRALPRPDRMRTVAEKWRPYRTVACWYLWRSLDGAAGF
jgi:3-methyladenine DNA glycosylase/8-oxoguanine DNA glycosylase